MCLDASAAYPFCETCNSGMHSSGPGYDFHESSYFMDCAFYCPRNNGHVVGAYFKLIPKEAWDTANEAATKNLIDLAQVNALFEVPSAADKAELIRVTPEGGILVDLSGLTKDEKHDVAESCKYYEHAGLLLNLTISEHTIGFVP